MPLSRLYVLPLPRQLVAISAPKWLLLTVACFGTFFPGAWSPEKLQMRSFHAWNSSTLPDRRANVKKAGKTEFKRRSGSLWCVVFLPLTSNNFLRCVTGRTLWKLSEIRIRGSSDNRYSEGEIRDSRDEASERMVKTISPEPSSLGPAQNLFLSFFTQSNIWCLPPQSPKLSLLISWLLKASQFSWNIRLSWENCAQASSRLQFHSHSALRERAANVSRCIW